MIGFLRAILDALGRVLNRQAETEAHLTQFQADVDDQFAALRAAQQQTLDAIEHLRVLIEGDDLPATVNPPTFSATGGNQ